MGSRAGAPSPRGSRRSVAARPAKPPAPRRPRSTGAAGGLPRTAAGEHEGAGRPRTSRASRLKSPGRRRLALALPLAARCAASRPCVARASYPLSPTWFELADRRRGTQVRSTLARTEGPVIGARGSAPAWVAALRRRTGRRSRQLRDVRYPVRAWRRPPGFDTPKCPTNKGKGRDEELRLLRTTGDVVDDVRVWIWKG